MLKLPILAFFCLNTLGCCLALRLAMEDAEVRQISVHNDIRRYILHIPASYKAGTNVPLFIVLHGGGGNGRGAETMTGLSRKADREGFLVVYPYGWGRMDEHFLTWNAGNCCGRAMAENKNDVEFIKQLILLIKNQYSIDDNRVYATGMSNGGMMSYRLACELSDQIRGIAPVSGAMNFEPCRPARPVAVMIFHGRADKHVLYAGGAPETQVDSHERIDRSVAFAADFWRRKNECEEKPSLSTSGKVDREKYRCKASDLEVVSIEGEGHTWPGGERGYQGADRPTTEISATDAIWEFFQAIH